MEISLFLAKAWGLYIVIISLALLFRKEALQRLVNSVQDSNTVLTYSFISLLVGILSILSHNIWSSDWRVLVTIFGWLAFLKGLTFLLHPEYSIKILKALKIQRQGGSIYVYLVIALIIGLYLINAGPNY